MTETVARGSAFVRPAVSHVRGINALEPGDPPQHYLDSLRRWRTETPDKIFLDVEGQMLTFAEIDHLSTCFANALLGLAIERGDRVGTFLDNSADAVICFFAINKLGAIWVPINTAYRGEFLRHQVADAGAKLVIAEAQYLSNMLEVAPDLPDLERILVRNGDKALAGKPSVEPLDAHRGTDPTPIDIKVSPDDIACLMYTSGTTGVAKGCIMTHGFLCSTARQRNRCVIPYEGLVTWSCLPLFHAASTCTVLLANLLAGERAAIATRFSVSGFWDEIERSGATSVTLLATMFPLVARAPETPAMLRCHGQLKVVTGVPLSVEDRKIWQERFGVEYMMSFGYGQTEANMVCFLTAGASLPPLDSMGPPADEFEVMAADDMDQPVPIGQVGELLVRPTRPSVMFSGYWGRPLETLQAMKNMWWHTGDYVRMDDEGYLYFIDRKKDYLRSRGENISSFEVESALLKHEDIFEVACHTVAGDAGPEEQLKTTVVLRAGSTLKERELFQWSLQYLPYFAVARFIEFRDALPKTLTGRVQKQQLRLDGVTGTTWDCEAEGLKIRRK